MASKRTVLVVDDSPDILEILDMELTDNGYNVRLARDGGEGLEAARKISPDLLILDMNMPVMDGLQLKASLNLDEATAQIPTIFLSASARTDLKVEGFRIGADDYVTKPFNMEELMARVDSTLQRHQRYMDLSMTDELTGLGNLHAYKKHAASLFNIAKRYGRELSLAVLDLDELKVINDTHGHKAGDQALRKVAEAMKLTFRRPDVLIRYGGDEFVVLLPESSKEQAQTVIRRFEHEFADKEFALEGLDRAISISVSCGLACIGPSILNEDRLFKAADQDLYREKARKKARKQGPAGGAP